jgi:hypothetical protein
VGSTPIGSTNFFKGLDIVRPLETFPGLPIVRIFVRIHGHTVEFRSDPRSTGMYAAFFQMRIFKKGATISGLFGSELT